MAEASVTHLIASHDEGWEQAVRSGVERADETLAGLRGLEIERLQAKVEDGRIVEWRATFNLKFLLASDMPFHE